jgi:hypothetical protein
MLKRWEAERAANPNLTTLQHSMMMGMRHEVYLARMAVARQRREIANIAGQYAFSLGRPLHFEGDMMVTGDPHAPFISYEWLERLVRVAKIELVKPRRLGVIGDWMNADKWSRFPHITVPPKWADERDSLKGMIDYLLSTFDEIFFLMGNHDRRVQKGNNGEFDDTDIIGMINSNRERVKSSNFGWCTVDSSGVMWRLTHPKNYRQQQLSVASELAEKYHQNIISFHEHHLFLGWDKFKRYIIVNGGCLADFSKFAYVNLDDSTSAGMQNGFVMLRNGTPYLFGPQPFTDWSRWL